MRTRLSTGRRDRPIRRIDATVWDIKGIVEEKLKAPAEGVEYGMPQIVNQKDLARPVHVRVGEPVVLRLEENPTTGYRWRLKNFPEGKLRVISDKFTVAGDALGAGGIREFVFEPLQAGHHVVALRNSFANRSVDSDREARLEIDVD